MYSFRDGSLVNKGNVAGGAPEQVFSEYFEENSWDDTESLSGPGSNLAFTAMIRKSLPRLLRKLGVRTLLDAPCGDLHWIREVIDAGQFDYIGGDIVPALIARLEAANHDRKYRFQVLDIVNDPLPSADLWLCRDCFIHLPHDMAERTTKKLAAAQDIGWFVLRLDDIQTPHIDANDPIVVATLNQLGQVTGEEYVTQFVNAAQKEVGVERNENAIRGVATQLTGGGDQAD